VVVGSAPEGRLLSSHGRKAVEEDADHDAGLVVRFGAPEGRLSVGSVAPPGLGKKKNLVVRGHADHGLAPVATAQAPLRG